jgi:hypothetical protein
MRKILFLALFGVLITIFSCTSRKESNVLIGAYVRDADTQVYFKDAEVTIMDVDSVVLAKPIVQEVVRDSQIYRYVWSVSRKDKYIIRATKDSFSTEYVNVSLSKDEQQKLADEIFLHNLVKK